jgi:hypothetical protein
MTESKDPATAEGKAKRYKLLSLVLGLVIVGIAVFGITDLRVTTSDPDTGKADFPVGGPAEFLYLDTERVGAYLAQVNGGTFDSEKLTSKLTRSLNAKLALEGVGEAGGSNTQESAVERVVTPTAASSYFALFAALEQEDEEKGGLRPIGLRYFEEDVSRLDQGRFVSFRTTALLSPIYLNAYLAVKHANTLTAIFPKSATHRASAEAFFEELGENPRVVFTLQPADLTQPIDSGKRKPFTYLLPMSAQQLTDERSLLKYGGGKFTVMGKVVRIFPERTRDHRPAYVDSATLETWQNPLRRAPGELLCRTEPRCAKLVREEDLGRAKRRKAIEASRARILTALNTQTAIDRRGAVIIPVAIYK